MAPEWDEFTTDDTLADIAELPDAARVDLTRRQIRVYLDDTDSD